jgi:hypothetical protein
LRGLGFRIPATLEVRDDRYLEENIYLIGSSNKIYVARVRWRCIIPETVGGEVKEGILLRDIEIKGGY